MHLNLFNYAEMLTLVVSIIYFNRIRNTTYVVLLPYMVIVVCAALAGKYLADNKFSLLNLHVSGVKTLIEFVTFYYLFYKNLKTPVLKKIVLYSIPLYAVLAIVNQVLIPGFNQYYVFNIIIGSLFLITFIFFYFYEAFSSMEPLYLIKEPMFWIAIGLFLPYLGTFTYYVTMVYLMQNSELKGYMQLFRLINNNLIIFEYICFSVAIITCSKIRRGSSWQSLPLL